MLLQLAGIFLNVLLPVFALVITGYFAGPRLGLSARTLTRYAYYILVPAFIFNIMSKAKLEAGLAVRMIIFIIIVQIGCALLGLFAGWFLRRPASMVAAYVLVAVFSNVGNFGLPIIEFRLGTEALVAASVFLLSITSFSFVIGVAAANWNKNGSWGAILAVLKTPALIALVPALFVNWMQIEPPLFVTRSVALLAVAMVPTMLVGLGVQLAGIGKVKLSTDVYIASGIRLIGGPVIAILLAIPFGLTGIERGAGIFQASMPVAVLASIVAMEYDLLPDFVTTTVLFSTLVSVITLTVVLAIV